MAYDAGTAKGTLELDAAKFVAELRKVEHRLDGLEGEARQARQSVSGFGSSLAKVVVGIGAAVAGFVALRAAVHGLVAGLSKASTDAGEFEQIVQELGVSLGLAGVQNVEAVTASLKEWASAVQNATTHSDGWILKVAQTLTILGVQEKDLKTATKAVLDYSAATGRDAVESARQFGKTLGGTLGELSEAFPALKELTQEQLRNGEAFAFAAEKLGGFSEKVADTTEGLRLRLENTIGDFSKQVGAVINPFINELRRAAIEIFQNLTALVQEHREGIAAAFQNVALRAFDFVESFISAITQARLATHDFKTTIQEVLPSVAGLFAELGLQIDEMRLAEFEFLASLPGAGKAFESTVKSIAKEVAESRQKVDAMAGAFGDATREAEGTRKKILEQGAALRAAVLPALEAAREKVRGMTSDFAKGSASTVNLGTSVKKAAASTAELAQAATEARVQMAAAAKAADEMDASTASAAMNIEEAATTAGESRRRGGSAGLNLADAFASLSTLREQERLLQASSFGPQFVTRAQRNVVEQVRATAQAQINQAFSEFTSGLIDELNRAGVFDPAARQDYIADRIAEAQRFGTLPPRSAGQASIAGAMSI